MKKLVSILIALSLCLTLIPFGTVFAEEDSAEVNKAAVSALEYLKILGICTEDDSTGSNITRGEFAALSARAGGYMGATGKENIFLDVTEENPYAAFINALAMANIAGGFSNGNFMPDETITVGEAVTLLVRITGYGYQADSIGGYPSGYMTMGKRLDITDGVLAHAGSPLTKDDALILIFNALDVDVMEQIKFGDDSEYAAREGKTLAYNTFRIAHIEGNVTAVDITALKGENLLKPYYVEVGGVTAYVPEGVEAPWEYLGYNVDAYFEYDERENAYFLKWIKKTSKNSEVIIDIEDIEEIGSGYINYSSEDGKTETEDFERVAPVIFNGVATSYPFNEALLKDGEESLSGSVTLLDNTRDGVADVIFVNAYTNIVVGATDPSESIVYDEYNTGKKLVIDTTKDEPYTIVYDLNGEELSFGDLNKDNVLSVYMSKDDADQPYWEIFRSNVIVDGKIVSIGGKGKKEIKIEDTVYEMTDICQKEYSSKIKAGMNVSLLLDKAGKVAGINLGSSLDIAYIIVHDNGEGLSGDIKLKCITDAGDIAVFDIAKSVKIDDKVYSEDDANLIKALISSSKLIYTSLGADSECVAQPMRYKVNESGEITFIDTVAVTGGVAATSKDISGDNALFMGARGKHRYREGGYVFGEKFLATASTKFFTCADPEIVDWTDEEDYDVVTVRNFAGGTSYDTLPLFYRDDIMSASHVMYIGETSANFTYEHRLSVVSDIYEGLVDGKAGTIVEVVGQGGKATLKFEEDTTFIGASAAEILTPQDLKIGDVIRYMTNNKGYVYKTNGIELYYRIQEGRTVKTASDAIGSFMISFGYAADKASDGMKMLKTQNKSDLATATEDKYVYIPNYNACSYVLYDDSHPLKTQWVKGGSWSSIMSYKDVGNDCTQVILQADTMTPRVMIIIKKKGATINE